MSASLLVDLYGTCQLIQTLDSVPAGSGLTYAASGATIGDSANMMYSDTYTNLLLAGTAVFGSGQLRIAVQTSDADTSGTYTDPTSGLPQLPTWFSSGGILILNSGGVGGGTLGAFVSGQSIQSGFAVAAAFQRPHTFARANVLSGDFYAGDLSATFIAQLRTTGSGGGFSYSPTSGTVNV